VQVEPIVQLNLAKLPALLGRLRQQMAPGDYRVIESWVQTILCLDELVERRDLAIHRLRRMAEALQPSTPKNSRVQNRAERRAAFVERPWMR